MRATALLCLASAATVSAQGRSDTPIRQSDLGPSAETSTALTLRDAARNDRWLGLGVRDVRWAPDGSGVYFRWNRAPSTSDVSEDDPWFLAASDGSWVEDVTAEEAMSIAAADVSWSRDGQIATWVRDGAVFVFEAAQGTRVVAQLDRAATDARATASGEAVEFQTDETLYRYDVPDGSLTAMAVRMDRPEVAPSEAGAWLGEQQIELFEHVREQERIQRRQAAAAARGRPIQPQPVPVEPGAKLEQLTMSPDGRWVTFVARMPSAIRPNTQYVDFLDASGYARVLDARAKVGEARDVLRLGVVPFDPLLPLDSIEVRWIDLAEAGDQNTVPHGPLWSPDGTRGVVQFIGEDHEDVWYTEVDLVSASVRVLTHDHDDAWIGGPPVQANYLQPALMSWLPGGDLVFASERSGWSHLHAIGPDDTVRPLTEGDWEVRDAKLSPDRETWLIQASREHPAEDHLYLMPASGGDMVRITDAPGRHEAWWSPDGQRLAFVTSDNTQLPDLFIGVPEPAAPRTRVTESGADAFYEHPLVDPEIVSFRHPDGGPLWAALYRPAVPNAERAAIMHIHGGGYRQFAHRGYSVYGYALHLGFIHYMLERGYTVLDFDYRGSAGYGRDYRTDISESMGIKDTDGAAAAARWLATDEGIDPDRIGIYGVSYGGFLTLTSLFRYPGLFGAGVARAAVTDWAHYSDSWTSRILGVPHERPEAYRRSSPIYYAEGLEDPLLITHGLVDDNVHFQDAARLVQRLIELEKDFDVMIYPAEPHTVETEASRYDLLRRQAAFFDEALRGIHE